MKYLVIIVAILYIGSSKTAYKIISKLIADTVGSVHDSNTVIIAVLILAGWFGYLYIGKRVARK